MRRSAGGKRKISSQMIDSFLNPLKILRQTDLTNRSLQALLRLSSPLRLEQKLKCTKTQVLSLKRISGSFLKTTTFFSLEDEKSPYKLDDPRLVWIGQDLDLMVRAPNSSISKPPTPLEVESLGT